MRIEAHLDGFLPRRLSRRNILKVLGPGGVLLVPLLRSIRAQAQGEKPKRFFYNYIPHGYSNARDFFPSSPGVGPAWQLSPLLLPLTPHKSDLVIVDNVTSAAEGASPTHTRGVATMLTARPQLPAPSAGGHGFGSGISIDQHIANVISSQNRFRSIVCMAETLRNDVRGVLSYRASNQPIQPTLDPAALFVQLFGAGGSAGKPSAEAQAQWLRRKSVLDGLKDEIALLNGRLSVDERSKMGVYLESIRELEKELGLGATADGGVSHSACDVPSMQNLSGRIAVPTNTKFERRARLHVAIIALAFSCDLTRVALLQWTTWNSAIVHRHVGASIGHHFTTHYGGEGKGAGGPAVVSKITEWYAQQFAWVLTQFKNTPDLSGGSLLDNSLVMWGSEVGEPDSHSTQRVPCVLAGKLGGRVKTDRALSANSHMADVFTALAQLYGLPTDKFGDAKYCKGSFAPLLA